MAFKTGIIAILGRPNAGKSTLLNALIGQKIAAVTDKPQTTRFNVKGIRHASSSQMIFLDTPGFHSGEKTFNQWMLDQTRHAILEADVAILLIAADRKWHELDKQLLQLINDSKCKPILVLNKIDLVSKGRLLPLMRKISNDAPDTLIIPISSLSTDGIDILLNAMEEALPEAPPLYPDDIPTDQTMRQLAAELIREKLFQLSREELPYSIAVFIESYEEPPQEGGLTRIGAVVLVERKSQKSIVIGKGGEFLKKVGTAARKELESMLGGKVFLSLHVKISKDWSQNPIKLKELGYA